MEDDQEEECLGTACPRKLNYYAPFLSTRRPNGATKSSQLSHANSNGIWRDTSEWVPFSWEESPGNPKDLERNDTLDMVVPPPKAPPGRLLSPPKETPKVDNCVQHFNDDDDDGCDADDEDDDEDNYDDVFSDANDLLSLPDALDMVEDADRNSKVEEQSRSPQSPSFIIERFLPDATASSCLANSKNLKKKSEGSYVSHDVRSPYSSPKGCGLDIFFRWRKRCGLKCPGQQDSTKTKPQWTAPQWTARTLGKELTVWYS